MKAFGLRLSLSIALMIALMIALALSGCTAAEYRFTDARAVIKLHNQYLNYQPKGGLRGGAYGYYDARNFQIQNGKYWCWWGDVYGVDCLEQGGCHAFAYSHAIQWQLQTNLGDEALHELINVCENPSDYSLYHGYPKCVSSAYPHSLSNEAYSQLCINKYGLSAAQDGAPDRDADQWLGFFDAGKTAILLVDGHYNAAVDYLTDGEDIYIQILDSAPNASVSRTWGAAYMVYKSGRINNIGVPAFGMGPFQYWVRLTDFLERYIKVDMVLSGGAWQGHSSGNSQQP